MRLDQALTRLGLVESRTKAQRLIADGDVLVNGVVHTKPSTEVIDSDILELASGHEYVGRAARKLIEALDRWHIDVSGASCLDVGASTGGFTEVLLERGARSVVALDVGHDQLHPRLREDSRVLSFEGVNARNLTPGWWSEHDLPVVSIVVADVSFISLTQILPSVHSCAPGAEWVVLIKPQFEVGRERVAGGIVTQAVDRERAIHRVMECAEGLGLVVHGILPSPIAGESGNHEYLCWLSSGKSANQTQWTQLIHDLTHL